MKNIIILFSLLITILLLPLSVNAEWVNGYYRNGSWVNGYYRTNKNLYKYDNYSFDNDWDDIYNDKSYYNTYGYDPEPYDNDYPSYKYSYDYGSSYYDNYYEDDYDYDYYDYDW